MTADLECYLSVTGPFGCVELANSCRTLSHIEHGNSGPMHVSTSCVDCCCPAFDPGTTGPADPLAPAPWYDANNPASAEFYGLYGDLTLSPTDVDTGPTTLRRRRLTFTGVAVSACDEGREYGDQWLRSILEGSCLSCRDLQATVFTLCGPVADGQPITFPNLRPNETLGKDCCDDGEPPALGVSTVPVLPADPGSRLLPKVRYVAGSYQQLTDSNDWPRCYGFRCTFSFDVLSVGAYGESIAAGTVTDPTTDLVGCCDCHLLSFATPETQDCSTCGRPCSCPTGECGELCSCAPLDPAPDECSTPTRTADPSSEVCRYSLPLAHTRVTMITPATPYDLVVPIVTLWAGSKNVDVMVTMYDAHPGLPDPATCKGQDIYDRRPPLTSPIGITIPAGTRVTLDGRTGEATQWCQGRTRAAGDLVASLEPGGALELPTVCCGRRVWVCVDLDCFAPPGDGFRVDVAIAPAVRI